MAVKILSSCIGCTLCLKVCPVSAITGELKSVHEVNEDRCIDCNVCGRVCNKDAILDKEGNKIETLKRKFWKIPVFDSNKCTSCSICIEVCGKRALVMSEAKDRKVFGMIPEIVSEKLCVGCGQCAIECPMDAIQMEVVND